uniref:Uncharacterized AAA domain-containing protein ycf46 n=1 Tax=Haraldiophyllum bonnemaisonii TaxID=167977 RepID=A0A4D6WWA4_9FLOR|nr:hypothetical protein [Haraldiophyllum bonnemaisonii]
MNFKKKIKTLISSQNSFIYILTNEEDRLEYTINHINKTIFNKKIYIWDFIDGYKNNPNHTDNTKRNPLSALDIIQNKQNKKEEIFFLKDFHVFMNDLSIIRKIKNLSKWLKTNNKCIIISAPEIIIPNILKESIYLIKFPLPNRKEIQLEIERIIKILKINNKLSLEELSLAYRGFSINKIRQSISKTIINKEINKKILQDILNEKKELIEKTNILDFYNSSESIENLGGLNNLKKWLQIRSNNFSQKAQSYGIPTPKGILLTGIQGTGKSLCAKIISQEWNLPLVKLNISKIFMSILGESEKKIDEMLNICEQISPCILWIDEIDKIFTNHKDNDSGTSNRINNIFLTWLSEKHNNIFIVATANNIKNLPLEMIRKGRFDEIFFLNLPKFHERLDIFKIHLKKIRPLTWHKYNIYYLSKISKKFSGAEIEQSIIEAMQNSFYENREFSTKDIIQCIETMIPLAFTDEKTILKLELWCKSGKIKMA